MKANNLIKLKEKGFNVPEFEVIKWEDKDKKIDVSKYHGKYAVRSSCELEDSELDSFAGQFDTYLNIDPKDIDKKVKECFNSINNKNISDYLKKMCPEGGLFYPFDGTFILMFPGAAPDEAVVEKTVEQIKIRFKDPWVLKNEEIKLFQSPCVLGFPTEVDSLG